MQGTTLRVAADRRGCWHNRGTMNALIWMCLAAIGTPASANCAPERMVKIVFRDATPSVAGTFVGLIESGKPTYLVRYDEYAAGLEPNPELFRKPSGITFKEGE